MQLRLPLRLLLGLILPACSAAPASFGGPGAPQEFRPLLLEQVADPQQLAATLASQPQLAGAADAVLILIAYDSSGALGAARVYYRGVSPDESRAVDAVLREELAVVGTPRSLGWYRLTADASPRLEETQQPASRPPRMLNRRLITESLQRLASRPQMPEASARVRIFIDPDGTVGLAEIVASSGRLDVDRELVKVARMARFTTAHLDEFPVCAWVEFPITFRRHRWDFPADQVAQRSAYGSLRGPRGPGF